MVMKVTLDKWLQMIAILRMHVLKEVSHYCCEVKYIGLYNFFLYVQLLYVVHYKFFMSWGHLFIHFPHVKLHLLTWVFVNLLSSYNMSVDLANITLLSLKGTPKKEVLLLEEGILVKTQHICNTHESFGTEY